MNDSVKKRPLMYSVARWLMRQAERLFAAIGFIAVIYWICFDCSCIVSNSMKPTLCGTSFDNGDRVLTERVSYWFRQPRRWEVVTLRQPNGIKIMKRVVGLPGEKIQMSREGQIRIDGQEIQRPPALDFLHYFPYGNLASERTVDCGEGYYVLGDDSRDSDDSRFNGPAIAQAILGRAWLIVAPHDRRRFVTP